MIFWQLPFRRWPWPWHVLAAASFMILILAAFLGWSHHRQATLQALHAQYQLLKTELDAAANKPVLVVSPDFGQSLPHAGVASDVVRDITSKANSGGVQIGSLGVERQAASASQVGRIQFNIVATSDYRATKAWLGDLLGRYPSLGVQSLSMRVVPDNVSRQDVQLTLVFFVQN